MRSLLVALSSSFLLAGCAVHDHDAARHAGPGTNSTEDCCEMMPIDGGISPSTTAPTATQPAAAGYVCPMHPEVATDKPGTCPNCGMALVPVAKKAGGMEGMSGHDVHH